jgi:hypothetical protein
MELYKAMIAGDHSTLHIILLMLPIDLPHHPVTSAGFDLLQAMIRGNTDNGFEAAHQVSQAASAGEQLFNEDVCR